MSNRKKPTRTGSRRRQREAERKGQSHTARVGLVIPIHKGLRPEQGTFALNMQADTDFSLAGGIFFGSLEAMGYMKSPELVAGAVASVLNSLLPEMRKRVVQLMIQGLHLYVSDEVQYGEMTVRLQPFYESLLSPEEQAKQRGEKTGIWTPGQQ